MGATRDKVTERTITKATEDITRDGYARVMLTASQADVLADAYAESQQFFAKPMEAKVRHQNIASNSNYGYRPMGVEYSATPDRVDINDSFALWSDRLDLIPESDSLATFTAALLGWRDLSAELISGILAELAKRYGASQPPAFTAASNSQVNSYFDTTAERDLLQDRHEDAHMLTVINANAPGLELFVDGEVCSGVTESDEVIVMPGSLLTRLTGGDIPPLYHQVRNLKLDHRMAIIYFVNPELTEPVMTWKDPEGQEPEDLREITRLNPLLFGLKALDVL